MIAYKTASGSRGHTRTRVAQAQNNENYGEASHSIMAILILIALFRVLYVPRQLALAVNKHNQLARRQLSLHLSYAVCFFRWLLVFSLVAGHIIPKIVCRADKMTSNNRNSIRIASHRSSSLLFLLLLLFVFCFQMQVH